jgi:hypothetical protein
MESTQLSAIGTDIGNWPVAAAATSKKKPLVVLEIALTASQFAFLARKLTRKLTLDTHDRSVEIKPAKPQGRISASTKRRQCPAQR